MTIKNIWRSTLTGCTYEMDTDWIPKAPGWELVATVEK